MKIIITIVALHAVLLLHAIETKQAEESKSLIIPSYVACRKIQQEWENAGYNKIRRHQLLKDYAKSFDPQKDTQSLQKLISADKYNNAYALRSISSSSLDVLDARKNLIRIVRFPACTAISPTSSQVCVENNPLPYHLTSIDFINKAVRNNNIAFLQVFFDLFPPNESDPIVINKSIGVFLLSKWAGLGLDGIPNQSISDFLMPKFGGQEKGVTVQPKRILGFKTINTISASEDITRLVFQHSFFLYAPNIMQHTKKPGYEYFKNRWNAEVQDFKAKKKAKRERRKKEIKEFIKNL